MLSSELLREAPPRMAPSPASRSCASCQPLLSSFPNDSAQETIRSRLQLFKSLPLSKPYIRNSHTALRLRRVCVSVLAVARSRRQLSQKFSEDEKTPGKLIVILAVVWPVARASDRTVRVVAWRRGAQEVGESPHFAAVHDIRSTYVHAFWPGRCA